MVCFPLNEARTIGGQLYELKALRVERVQIGTNEAAERAQYEREKKLWEDRIEVERQAYALATKRVEIAQKELDLITQKATFYEDAYNVCKVNNKKGFWCKMKKVFTLGVARCR